MTLFTIGFTKKTAQRFFEALKASGARRLVDVRLNNVSQLAGFAKRDDLAFFLRGLCGMEYAHRLELAPTQELLDAYKKDGAPWAEYERTFRELIAARRIEQTLPRELMDQAVLLCSEDKPAQCHRRVVAEYLSEKWGGVEIRHL